MLPVKLPGLLTVAGMFLVAAGALMFHVAFGLIVAGIELWVLASMTAKGA